MGNKLILLFGIFVINSTFSHAHTTDSSSVKRSNETFNQTEQVDSVTVYVSFTVEKTGKITHVGVSKMEGHQKCSEKTKRELRSEAIRVIQSMPAWEPKNERTKFILPIKFRFDE